jgi:hypothetical protein
VVITDKIYVTRENRQWLKALVIRYSGKPLGRPSVKSQTQCWKRKQKIKQGIPIAIGRNQIESKFRQGKNGYNLNKVRARTSKTSESWIAAIFFVMNLIRFDKEFLSLFLKEILSSLFSVPDIFIWRKNEFMLVKTK